MGRVNGIKTWSPTSNSSPNFRTDNPRIKAGLGRHWEGTDPQNSWPPTIWQG